MLLSANSLNDGKKHGINLGDIRSFAIKNFIGFTKYFTEGGFINLINNKKEVFNTRFSQIINEDTENENAVRELAEVGEEETRNQLISFDKINPSLLLFQENGEHFSIISNLKDREETQRYLQLMRTQDFRYQMPVLKDNTAQNIFLSQLQIVLNLKNDIGNPEDKKGQKEEENQNKNQEFYQKEKKYDDDSYEEEEESEEEKVNDYKKIEITDTRLKSLFEIAGNYVFTADNYFKMALILLRIRAKIPVIMMGETGCGKTSLIRKLSEMLNNGDKNKMKI